MKKAHELRQIVNRRTMTSEQGVLEMNVHAAVAVFYIEYDRVPADLTPAPDDAQSAIACGHHSGQVHCADFEVARHGRSEERRVGKECRDGWWTEERREKV